jgi:deoxyadenosine/deoxycytidine kinase
MVSFFVDDRSLEVDALRSIHGIEARGKAMEIKDEERRQYEHLYKSRYPELGNFARNTALIRISVERYDVVFNFQNVYILKMLDDQGQRMVLP